ncbi:diguanylate cyclase [Aestuariibacter sp. A3R04]|uniref:sensor domain-containing diguanylate cyclase n=1 Tax=Aestuariibacter sp. A3R04 TaxID=2841571 RepID=UPI001C08D350|nr:diguanylate cyclase [Aestuariibacter sp. A3R04]MBU3020373.1 diguanylate cyclase [Aestuariibacter sp. A3R04]
MTLNREEKEQFVLLRSLFNNIGDAVYIIDPESANILDVNKAGYEDLGMEADEVLSHTVFSLQKDVLDIAHWREMLSVLKSSNTFVFSGHHVRKDGTEFPVEVHTNYLVHDGVEYLISIARDITERVRMQAELKTREPQLRYMLNAAGDGLWDWNILTDEVFFSPQLKRMLGYGPHEMKPHLDSWKSNVHPDDLPRVYGALQSHLQGENTRYDAEYRLRNRNGQYLWVHDHGTVCERNELGEATRVVGMVRNVTASKELEQKLRELASRDELTQLLNRRAGYEQFSRYLALSKRQGQPLSVALFDLDHFKQINDQCGHLVGDKVLKNTASLMAAELRKSDVLLRWGGEEFLLLMPDTDIMHAFKLCERLRRSFSQNAAQCELPHQTITLSGGIACYPANGNTIEDIVKCADDAMYKAKNAGRDKVCISDAP